MLSHRPFHPVVFLTTSAFTQALLFLSKFVSWFSFSHVKCFSSAIGFSLFTLASQKETGSYTFCFLDGFTKRLFPDAL